MKATHPTDNGPAASDAFGFLAVDTAEFLRYAGPRDYAWSARLALFKAIHRRTPEAEDRVGDIEHTDGFPTAIDYRDLAVHCDGYLALLALEVMPMTQVPRAVLAVDIASQFILPLLQQDAPEIADSAESVINLFADWQWGSAKAEVYGKAALGFKLDIKINHHGTSLDTLLDALPLNGVDWYAYRDGSDPSEQWFSLGQYLAQRDRAGMIVEELREALGLDDPDLGDADEAGEQWWNDALDQQIDAIARHCLQVHEAAIKRLIAAALGIAE